MLEAVLGLVMLAAPLMTAGVPVELPPAEPAGQTIAAPAGSLVVTIVGDGGVFVGEEKVAAGGLAAAVTAAAKGDTGTTILVRGDKGVDYATVRNVLEALNSAGFSRVGLVAAPAAQDN